jgi:glycosyltransferase involved in cell wall biosynthesis
VFAGRMIPEKGAPAGVAGVAAAARRMPELRGIFFGDGPERDRVLEEIARSGLGERLQAPGFVAAEVVEDALERALCMLLPSRREGYGLIVVEAAARGTPSIVVAGEDNAATELIAEGANGFVAASAEPEAIAAAIERVHAAGEPLRDATAEWFAANARRLSLDSSLETVMAVYRGAGSESPDGARDPSARA